MESFTFVVYNGVTGYSKATFVCPWNSMYYLKGKLGYTELCGGVKCVGICL